MAKTKKKIPSKKKPSTQVADPKIKCKFTRMVPIDSIRPYPNNPNVHTREQIEKFAAILKYQGTRRPFRVSNRSNFLTVGHGQLEAYKFLGWTMCPVDFQDYEDEKQEFADIVADNSLATWAQMDFEMISEQIKKIGDDFNVEFLGIDGFSLDPLVVQFPQERGKNELTKDERTDEYMASQSRNVILVYSLPEFTRVTTLLAEIMKAESHESFSDAVSAILEAHATNLNKKGVARRKEAPAAAPE